MIFLQSLNYNSLKNKNGFILGHVVLKVTILTERKKAMNRPQYLYNIYCTRSVERGIVTYYFELHPRVSN